MKIILDWTVDWPALQSQLMAANIAIRNGIEEGGQSVVTMSSGDKYAVTREGDFVVIEKMAVN